MHSFDLNWPPADLFVDLVRHLGFRKIQNKKLWKNIMHIFMFVILFKKNNIVFGFFLKRKSIELIVFCKVLQS